MRPQKITIAVALAVVVCAVTATMSGAATDPRKCGADMSQVACGKGAAVQALRKSLERRFGMSYLWQGGTTCRGFVGLLRYRCTFRNGGEHGSAFVLLGHAPTWKPTVTIKTLICDVQPTRKGCH